MPETATYRPVRQSELPPLAEGTEVTVSWTVEVEVDTDDWIGAAAEALYLLTQPGSVAHVFDVTGPDGTTVRVDLDAYHGQPGTADYNPLVIVAEPATTMSDYVNSSSDAPGWADRRVEPEGH